MYNGKPLMKILEPQHDLRQVDERQLLLQPAHAAEQRVQISPRQPLHHEVEIVTRLEAEEELHDEGMVRLDEHGSLAHHAPGEARVRVGLSLALNLDGEEVACRLLPAQVDSAERPLGDGSQDLEVADAWDVGGRGGWGGKREECVACLRGTQAGGVASSLRRGEKGSLVASGLVGQAGGGGGMFMELASNGTMCEMAKEEASKNGGPLKTSSRESSCDRMRDFQKRKATLTQEKLALDAICSLAEATSKTRQAL